MTASVNMEQVNFDQLTSFYIVNNDQSALLLESLNASNLNENFSCHPIQEVFNVVNSPIIDNSGIMVSESNDLVQNNYCLLKKNTEDKVVELSIGEDYSVQLKETSPTKKDYEAVTSGNCSKLQNSIGNGSLNEILELTSSQDDVLKQQYELVTSNVEDNLRFALQLSDVNLQKVNPIVSSTCIGPVKTNNIAPPRKSFILSGVSPSTLKGQKTLLDGMSCKIGLELDTESSVAKNRLAQQAKDQKTFIPQKAQISTTNDEALLLGQGSVVSPLIPNGVKTVESQPITKHLIIGSSNPVQNSVLNSQVINAFLNGLGNINNISSQSSAVRSEQVTVPTSSPSLSTTPSEPVSNNSDVAPNQEPEIQGSSAESEQITVPTSSSSSTPSATLPSEPVSDSTSRADTDATPNQDPKRLSAAQLKRIAKYLQNNRKKGAPNQPSTVFDPETNTKVICRVFYPEDLVMNSRKKRKACIVRKGGRKKKKADTIEDTEEQKEIRRTRSGRLSRPPKYVKDYENIDKETEENKGENNENALAVFRDAESCVSWGRKKPYVTRFKCPTCGKIYFGIERMAHHFRKNPTHGDNNFLESLRVKSDDNQKPTWRKPPELKSLRYLSTPSIEKLKKGLSRVSDEALVEVAGARVASVLSPYDYLMSRARKEGGIRRLLQDLTSLFADLATLAPAILQPQLDLSSENTISVEDDRLCRVLNLPPGRYLPVDAGLGASSPSPEAPPPAPSAPPPPEPPALPPDLLGDILCPRSSSSFDSFDVADMVSERLDELIPSDDLVAGLLTAVDSQSLPHSLMSDTTDSGDSLSGSTEDLIRTLESYTPSSTHFDFTVLTPSFPTDRG